MYKFAVAILLLIALPVTAQVEKTKNYRKFDQRTLHFGFMLGFNSANFVSYVDPEAYTKYGLRSLENASAPGGQVGIVSTLKLWTPIVRLRFIPTLSFQERILKYYYTNPEPNATTDLYKEERVNSTNLDFPLMLQFRTLRLNNFASYVLVGGQYSHDLQSLAESTQSKNDPFIKIKADDFQGQVGVGVEFFAQYFKCGLEIKCSQSFSNSLIQDNTVPSSPINSLTNRVWWFSIIFEG